MWKSGTFDLEDINETLIDEIVFFDISYPGMGEPGCVIFIKFIAIVTICHQMNSNEYMKEHTLRLSFWRVKMGKNFSF